MRSRRNKNWRQRKLTQPEFKFAGTARRSHLQSEKWPSDSRLSFLREVKIKR